MRPKILTLRDSREKSEMSTNLLRAAKLFLRNNHLRTIRDIKNFQNQLLTVKNLNSNFQKIIVRTVRIDYGPVRDV